MKVETFKNKYSDVLFVLVGEPFTFLQNLFMGINRWTNLFQVNSAYLYSQNLCLSNLLQVEGNLSPIKCNFSLKHVVQKVSLFSLHVTVIIIMISILISNCNSICTLFIFTDAKFLAWALSWIFLSIHSY